MKTDRFETFFDAVLAIVITILVLKLHQPSAPTISAILQLNTNYIIYIICFLVLFMIWYDNHNLFQLIDNVNNRIMAVYAFQIFFISLLPYFASWVSKDIYSIAAETMFGLTFLAITVMYMISVYEVYRENSDNLDLAEIEFTSVYKFIPILLNIIGLIITYTVWVPATYVFCLASVILWLIFSRRQNVEIQSKERFESLIDAIIAIIITVIVLEFPMAANGSWASFFDLKLEFLVYIASFIVCFVFWNYTNNLFDIVKKINNKVIWIMGIILFVLSLIPYTTLFIWYNFTSFIPNLSYGLNFIIVAILTGYCVKVLKAIDRQNTPLQENVSYTGQIVQIIIVCAGIAVGYLTYPPIIVGACLISMLISRFLSIK